MTGFGAGAAALAGGTIHLELRAVNHRFAEVRVNLPLELASASFALERRIVERAGRGRYDLSGHWDGLPESLAVDLERARAVMKVLGRLRDELAPGAELPLSLLGAAPAVFAPAVRLDREAVCAAAVAALDEALAALARMRRIEGRALAADLRRHLEEAREAHRSIAELAAAVAPALRERQRERVQRLLAQSGIEVDPVRIELEIVLGADRCDVSEELSRLGSHFDQLDALLDDDGAVGRTIDFLLQETMREANTIGAKCQSAPVAQRVVELRARLERMREQAHNIQ
jgi:uncharacterized protein (TIGR00255 family)